MTKRSEGDKLSKTQAVYNKLLNSVSSLCEEAQEELKDLNSEEEGGEV